MLIFAIILFSQVPPISKESLVHHPALPPKLYLQHGGIYEIPFMKFTCYLMNLDLLYMISPHFGNGILPEFMHLIYG
jgi:hypothetical protein